MHLERDKFRAALVLATIGGAAASCGNEPPNPPAATPETEQTAGAEPTTAPAEPPPTAAAAPESPAAEEPATVALSESEARALGPTME